MQKFGVSNPQKSPNFSRGYNVKAKIYTLIVYTQLLVEELGQTLFVLNNLLLILYSIWRVLCVVFGQ